MNDQEKPAAAKGLRGLPAVVCMVEEVGARIGECSPLLRVMPSLLRTPLRSPAEHMLAVDQ